MMSFPDVPATASSAMPGTDGQTVHFNFENTYARLPERFYARLDPIPVAAPRLRKVNVELARQLGVDPADLESPTGCEILAGDPWADGSGPRAIAYPRHQ